MMPDPKRKIRLIVLAIILLVVIVAAAAYFLLTATLEINKLPADTKILLNGREYQAAEKFRKRVLAGDYLVQINAPDYTPYWQKIKLKNASTTLLDEPIIPLITSKILAQNISDIDKSPFNDQKYYFITDGVLYESDKNFNNSPKTPRTLQNVHKMRWSPSGQLAVVFQEQKTKLYDFRQYDLITQTVVDWGSEIKEALWLDEENIVCFYQSAAGEKNLILTNRQRSKNEVIADLRPYVDNLATLIMVPASENEVFIVGNDLIKVNLSTRAVIPVTTSGNLISGQISPDKQHLVLTTATGLTYYNISTNQTMDVADSGTIDAYAWYKDRVFAVSRGRLFITGPQLLEPMYFNQQSSPILANCDKIVIIENTVVLKSEDKLYNINIR